MTNRVILFQLNQPKPFYILALLILASGCSTAQVNVKDFGARGDNLSDDAPAIRAAIGAANGAVVHFPSGVYRIASPITGGASGTILEGSGRGPGGTFINNVSSSHAIVIPGGIYGYTVRDLSVVGAAASLDAIHIQDGFAHVRLINLALLPKNGCGVSTYEPNGTKGGIDIYLESVRVYYGTSGFYIWSNASINDVTLINTYADSASGDGYYIHGVNTASLTNTNADGNNIGYRLGAVSAIVSGATAEANKAGAFLLVGAGPYTLINTHTWGQIAPYTVNSQKARAILMNPISGATPSGYSLNVLAASEITLWGKSGLDAGLSPQTTSFLSSKLGPILTSTQ